MPQILVKHSSLPSKSKWSGVHKEKNHQNFRFRQLMEFLQNCSTAINCNYFKGQLAETSIKLLAIPKVMP